MKKQYISDGFSKIDRDLFELMSCLDEVLTELGEHETRAFLPWLGREYNFVNQPVQHHLAQVYSISFQLLNIVEENTAKYIRRLREINDGISEERGLWGYHLNEMINQGKSPEQLAQGLSSIYAEVVFTAHPTEAKKGSVLEQHRLLYRLLSARDRSNLTPQEIQMIRSNIKLCLERLWRSGEIFLEQPQVSDERKSILFYLSDILPETVIHLDSRLKSAWKEIGLDTSLIEHPSKLPHLSFATWVGGDRDGHPFVTPEVTQETLEELHRHALLIVNQALKNLANDLPLSNHFQTPSIRLVQRLEVLKNILGHIGDEIIFQHPGETWKQFVLLIQALLKIDSQQNQHDFQNLFYKHPSELMAELTILEKSLEEIGAKRIIVSTLWPILRLLQVFGFHLAKLDIRQNSSVHNLAMDQILQATGQVYDGELFSQWSEEKRLYFIRQELKSNKPLLSPNTNFQTIGCEAEHVLRCYQVLSDHINLRGKDGLGALIVSMTHQLSDLLIPIILAREVGLAKWENDLLFCPLPIVPLFETFQDLQNSVALMKQFFDEPVINFALQKNIIGVQQIMLGYSDSNKDCGLLASQWALREAQKGITALANRSNINLVFFHGRGGTISRGAGPTHLFLDALPAETLRGNYRMTEQGETIAQKYANLSTASYHLELLLAGVSRFSILPHSLESNSDPFVYIFHLLAKTSHIVYRNLINLDGFIDFYEASTPIDALEASRIGSRPKRRTGKRTLSDLRAIPWVFSWNQARYYLPGWFGVGSALEKLEQEQEELFFLLKKNIRNYSFLYYIISNVETNIASADIEIMYNYSSLVEDNVIKNKIFTVILDEFKRTQNQLYRIFGSQLNERRPRMAKTLLLRSKALELLHEQQIALLRNWRIAKKSNHTEADKILPEIFLSINAIASGLRTTG